MIISEARFAAGVKNTDGTVRIFDDISCLLRSLTAPGAGVVWVHDFQTERWFPAKESYVLHSQGLITPMGSGLAAVASHDAAEALQREYGGTILQWQEAQAVTLTGTGTALAGSK